MDAPTDSRCTVSVELDTKTRTHAERKRQGGESKHRRCVETGETFSDTLFSSQNLASTTLHILRGEGFPYRLLGSGGGGDATANPRILFANPAFLKYGTGRGSHGYFQVQLKDDTTVTKMQIM